MAKRFFFVCAGMFLLALAYHLGAMNARAQAPGNPVVGIVHTDTSVLFAVTANGDVFCNTSNGLAPWERRQNIFSGPTPAQQQTLGQVKARYAR